MILLWISEIFSCFFMESMIWFVGFWIIGVKCLIFLWKVKNLEDGWFLGGLC